MRLLPFLRFSTCYFSHSSLGVTIRSHYSFHSPFSSCHHQPPNRVANGNFIFFIDFVSPSAHRETYQISVLLISFACCYYKEHAVRLFVFADRIDAAAFEAIKSNWITAFDRVAGAFLNYIFLVLFIFLDLSLPFNNSVHFILRRLEINAIGYRFNTQHNRSSHSIESKSGAAKSDATIIRKLFMQCN